MEFVEFLEKDALDESAYQRYSANRLDEVEWVLLIELFTEPIPTVHGVLAVVMVIFQHLPQQLVGFPWTLVFLVEVVYNALDALDGLVPGLFHMSLLVSI